MRIKNSGRKMKFLKIVIGLLFAFGLLVVVNIVAKAFEINKTLQKDYIELSANPKITQEFMTTMKYKIWISTLHKYVNYDNFLMRPLFSKMNYHFKETKANLEQNSIDDIILWCLLYDEIYGLAYNDDKSMNFKNLDLDKNNLSVNEKLYSYLQDGYNKYIDKSALKDTVKIKFSQKLSDIENFSNIVIKNYESVNSK